MGVRLILHRVRRVTDAAEKGLSEAGPTAQPRLFLAFRQADAALARRVAAAAQSAPGPGLPIEVALDAPDLADEAWAIHAGPAIAACQVFMVLEPGWDGLARVDPAVGRAVARAAEVRARREDRGEKALLIGLIVPYDVPGMAEAFGLNGDWAFDRVPAAGPLTAFGGDEDAWVRAAGADLATLARSQAAPAVTVALSAEAQDCRLAAERLEVEAGSLSGEDADVLREAAAAVNALAALPDASVRERAQAVREVLGLARRRLQRLQATSAVQAVESAYTAVGMLQDAAAARGFPVPASATPALADRADRQLPVVLRATRTAFDRMEQAGEQLATTNPAAASGQAALGRRVADEARIGSALTRAVGRHDFPQAYPYLESKIDLGGMERAAQRIERQVSAAVPLRVSLGRAARRLLDRIGSLARVVIVRIRGLANGATIGHSAGLDRTPLAVWRQPVPGVDESVWPEMVTLPVGRFWMGSADGETDSFDDERPRHEVEIGRIVAMGVYPVTFSQWDAARAAGADLPAANDEGWGRDRRPVIDVSWNDSRAYLAWLNDRLGLTGHEDAYRLPSEAEWEYACRAKTTTAFAFGDTLTSSQANIKLAYDRRTTPVGSFEPNAWGLFDMHGNVFEWCEDRWHKSYRRAPADGRPWTTGRDSSRVVRGGSWSDISRSARSAYRNHIDPANRNNYIGFRLARTL